MNEQEYEEDLDMFQSPAWKRLIERAATLDKSLTQGAVDSAVSNELWQYTRGQIHQLRALIGYETVTHSTWEQSQNVTGTDDIDYVDAI